MHEGFERSYASTYGIRNLAGRGKKVTCVVKGESVRWTSSSKLVDTCPFKAFIIMSIFSFVVCISCAMCNAPTSSLEGRLVSYWRHYFPLGHPFLGDHSLRDDCCHICPYLVCHSNRSAPDHSVALAVIPTHGSTKWAVQLLRQGFVLASPMCWAGSWSLGW